LLPPRLTLGSATTAPAALAACRENSYRVILVDTTLPDADSAVLAGQIRMLQKDATIAALTLKSSNNVEKELAAQGFQGVLFKPFAPDAIEDFVAKYFDAQVLLTCSDDLLKVGPMVGNPERAERYFNRLSTLFPPAIEQVAAACFENTIVDLSDAPIQDGGRLAKLMADVSKKATGLGLQLRIVGNPELKKVLDGFEETGRIPIFASVNEARA
jgi:CheY-like chemotaxis protein